MASNINKLLENINKTASELEAPGFKINDFLLKDSEIVKNIILESNPNITRGDANLMVDGLESQIDNESSDFIPELESLVTEGDTEFKKVEIKKSIEKAKSDFNPIPESDDFYVKARDIKNNIIKNITEYIRKIKELIKDIALATITISQAVPGSTLLITTPVVVMPSFNIPGMITMLTDVIAKLNDVKSKCADVKETFINFSRIKTVCSPEAANQVSGVLNTMNNTLNNTICPFSEIVDKFTSTALGAIKFRIKKERDEAKSITKQLISLRYLPLESYSVVFPLEIPKVEKILKEWRVVDRTNPINAVKRRTGDSDVNFSMDEAIKNINELENINTKLSELTNLKENTQTQEVVVYDIEFPDGVFLKGLTSDEINGYKSTYNIIYSNNLKFNNIT